MTTFADLRSSRELFVNLTLREIRGKYKRTALGQAWSLVNPLAAMAIYSLVFGFLLPIQVSEGDPSGLRVYALWLLCGLLPWLFISAVITSGMGSLISDANLIKKVWFPRVVIVVAVAASWLFTHAIEMGVLVVVLLIFGSAVVPWIPGILLMMVLVFAFATGIALMLAVANVYFRDTQHFVSIFMQLWFYLSPVLYPFRYVTEGAQRLEERGIALPLEFIYRLNPVERFIQVFRSMMYDNAWPALADVIYCVVAAVVSLTVGYLVFNRHEARIAEEL